MERILLRDIESVQVMVEVFLRNGYIVACRELYEGRYMVEYKDEPGCKEENKEKDILDMAGFGNEEYILPKEDTAKKGKISIKYELGMRENHKKIPKCTCGVCCDYDE